MILLSVRERGILMKHKWALVFVWVLSWAVIDELSWYVFSKGLLVQQYWYLLVIELMWFFLGAYVFWVAERFAKCALERKCPKIKPTKPGARNKKKKK